MAVGGWLDGAIGWLVVRAASGEIVQLRASADN